MPTYSYECKKCGHEHEVFHAISAKPQVMCPECGGACIKLLGTGAGIIFKGSGFYETDYKRKNGGASGKNGGHSTNGAAKSAGETTSGASGTSKEAKSSTAKAKDS